jgi:hypothetical protein
MTVLRTRRVATHLIFGVVAIALITPACNRDRTVTVGWDTPRTMPAKYRVLIDGRVTTEIAPPPADPTCRCLKVSIVVPRGRHTIRVDACTVENECTPSVELAAD